MRSPPIRYGYANLYSADRVLIRTVVSGREVWDLGAGHGALTRWLAPLATRIVAIEKEYAAPSMLPANVEWRRAYFADVTPPSRIDVVVVSWPSNYETTSRGLIPLLHVAERIIYIAVNDGVTACGTETLWNYLSTRPIQAQSGDVTVYGPQETP